MKVLAVLAGLSASALANFPGGSWEQATPESQGMSSSKLAEAFAYAQGKGSFCASVHRNGFLVQDEYWLGFEEARPSIVWSISKAITSTLIGVAERERRLSTEDFAHQYIAEWAGGKAANVTIDMLLRHDSGRYYDFFTDFILSQFKRSQTDFAIGLRQQHEPGTHYQYNQQAIQTLERVLTVAMNESVPELTARELFKPLGFESESYWQEKSILLPVPNDPLLYGGMWTSCRDLARFGTLWLHRGKWNGHTVFTDDFYEKGTTPPPAPRPGRRYHWGSGPNYRASGMGEQMVVFNPEKQLVMTRIGGPIGLTFSSSTFVNLVMESLLDGDMGSWSYERDLIENPRPKEEEQLIQFLIDAGVEVTESGEIKPIGDQEGWFEYIQKVEESQREQ